MPAEIDWRWTERGVGSRFAAFLSLLEGLTQAEPEEDGEEFIGHSSPAE